MFQIRVPLSRRTLVVAPRLWTKLPIAGAKAFEFVAMAMGHRFAAL